MDTPIKIETFPWNHGRKGIGLRVEGFLNGTRVLRLYISDSNELPWYLGHIERVHGHPVEFGWVMS